MTITAILIVKLHAHNEHVTVQGQPREGIARDNSFANLSGQCLEITQTPFSKSRNPLLIQWE